MNQSPYPPTHTHNIYIQNTAYTHTYTKTFDKVINQHENIRFSKLYCYKFSNIYNTSDKLLKQDRVVRVVYPNIDNVWMKKEK